MRLASQRGVFGGTGIPFARDLCVARRYSYYRNPTPGLDFVILHLLTISPASRKSPSSATKMPNCASLTNTGTQRAPRRLETRTSSIYTHPSAHALGPRSHRGFDSRAVRRWEYQYYIPKPPVLSRFAGAEPRRRGTVQPDVAVQSISTVPSFGVAQLVSA